MKVEETIPNEVWLKIMELSRLVVESGAQYKEVIKCLKINIIDEAITKYGTAEMAGTALGITRRMIGYNLHGEYRKGGIK